jgi:uncharacterized repeat protein (TIGR01451 family)
VSNRPPCSTRALRTVICIFVFTSAAAHALPPGFGKSFSPTTVGPGSVSTLHFEITGDGEGARDLAFTDNLPAGLSVASPPNALTTCVNGQVSAAAGGSSISFSNGEVGNGEACSVSVDVSGDTVGTHTNTSGALTSTVGNSGSASASLTVATDRPGFTKGFAPSSIFFGGRSTLTFVIDNTLNTNFAANLVFTDSLPPGMTIADPANVSTTCPAGGTLTAEPGGETVSYSLFSAFLAAGASCSISVDVRGNALGALGNTSGELSAFSGSTSKSSGMAGATLTVNTEKLALSKSFNGDPVSPGGTLSLDFTLRNLDRGFSLSNIAFSDDLGSVLGGLTATGVTGNGCGGSVTAGSTVSLSGGSLGPESSCTISVGLQVPAGASPGIYTNTSSAVTGDLLGTGVSGNPASDDLFVSAVPRLSKTFVNDPIGAGETASLLFTVTNTSSTSAATDIAFSDEFTTFLPFPVSATLPATPCGAGSTLSMISFGSERQGIALNGGTLAASDSCSFQVDLDTPAGLPAGIYTNTTGAITATVDGIAATGNSARDELTVISAPLLTKEFIDDPVLPGGSVTLRFTLTSNGVDDSDGAVGIDATDISFTDDLGATLSGLTATGLPAADVCGSGSLLDGGTTLSFTGGVLGSGEQCSFSVVLDVPASALAGSHNNTTSSVEATVSGRVAKGNPATDNLRIAGLTLGKAFTDDPALPGGSVTLEFTVENTSANSEATEIFFQDNLDNVIPGLAYNGATLGDVCGTGSSLTALNGGTLLQLQGGILQAGESCSFNLPLDVPASAATNSYLNSTSGFRALIDGQLAILENALDDLAISNSFLALAKEFTDGEAVPGGTTNIRFSLSNLHGSASITDAAFNDNLDETELGMTAVGLPLDACGGTVNGGSIIEFTGGSLQPLETCVFDVQVQVPTTTIPGSTLVNTTSDVTGNLGSTGVQGAPASDSLTISSATLSKSLPTEEVLPGDSALLSFTIENQNPAGGIGGLNFLDNLGTLPIEAPSGLPLFDVCGPGSELSYSAPNLELTGGTLLAGGSCTFSIPLQVSAGAVPGNYLNVTTDLRSQGGVLVDLPASAWLTVGEVVDADGDGVLDGVDLCPDTVIPEGVPTKSLGKNNFALVDDDGVFDTNPPNGQGPSAVFTIEDTAGCSCEQIIEAQGLGSGHEKFGCSIGEMENWVQLVNP